MKIRKLSWLRYYCLIRKACSNFITCPNNILYEDLPLPSPTSTHSPPFTPDPWVLDPLLDHVLHLVVSVQCPLIWNTPSSLWSLDHDIFEEYKPVILQKIPQFGFFYHFLLIRFRLCILAGRPVMLCLLVHHTTGLPCWLISKLVVLALTSWLRWCLPGFTDVKLLTY